MYKITGWKFWSLSPVEYWEATKEDAEYKKSQLEYLGYSVDIDYIPEDGGE